MTTRSGSPKVLPISIKKRSPNTRSAADTLLQLLRASDPKRHIDDNDLLPAYVVSVCAAIEHRMNDAYIDHFHRLLGFNYASYAAPYLRFRVEEKLGMLMPLLSDFKYELNRDSQHVKFLFRLFRLRNRLVHQVPHVVEGLWEQFEDHARMHYPSGEYRHSHAHPEWESVKRKDLVSIHAALTFWMVTLHDIAKRIGQNRFNHRGTLKPLAARRSA